MNKQEKRLQYLESQLELLRDYARRCPKQKKSLVARMIAKIDNKVNRYYASLSLIG